jgi:hypothetical protein
MQTKIPVSEQFETALNNILDLF